MGVDLSAVPGRPVRTWVEWWQWEWALAGASHLVSGLQPTYILGYILYAFFDFLSDLLVESYWLEDAAMLGSSFCGQEVTAKQAKHSYIIHVFFGGPPEFLHSWTPKQSFLDDFRKGWFGQRRLCLSERLPSATCKGSIESTFPNFYASPFSNQPSIQTKCEENQSK